MLCSIHDSYEQSSRDLWLFLRRVTAAAIPMPAEVHELLEDRLETAMVVAESARNELERRRTH
ncbi:hypothetical protein H1S01_15875 [Heliobacterium chlorum]|uniref:Uncharacterized protein n=1 Tax=Heliobacterium chlorum TaxID=2698 RepID=A0ABR7T7X4_HELCL|nr:hypothetical protein [Heliobacterium chlorum]MBC9785964.1 hypothetical protein [Heliobacterium chlorum]